MKSARPYLDAVKLIALYGLEREWPTDQIQYACNVAGQIRWTRADVEELRRKLERRAV